MPATVAEARPVLAGRVRLAGGGLAVAGATVLGCGTSAPAVTGVAAWSGPWGWAGAAVSTAAGHGPPLAWAAASACLTRVRRVPCGRRSGPWPASPRTRSSPEPAPGGKPPRARRCWTCAR
ncbi:hypothetical protein ACWCYZ_09380 [Streptomyces virginiae]